MPPHEDRQSQTGSPVVNIFGRVVACLVMLLVLAPGGMSASYASDRLQASGYKMAGDAARTRLVMHFDREPELRWFLLRGPHRLVIDLPETSFSLNREDLEPRGMVSNVGYGNLEQGRSRLIVSFDGPFEIENLDILKNDEQGYRLVADIVAGSETAFEQALADQIETTGSMQSTPQAAAVAQTTSTQKQRFRIVIDPGHGGIDTGAEGPTGTLEKTITLAFALELKKKLDDTDKYDVFLTRDRDLFLRLDERVRIARQHAADLFVSIHADSIRFKDFRGATVYTVADKASDAEAAAKAIRENLADEIAGIVVEHEHEGVADILADLIRRETQTFSIRFARSLIGELSSSIKMIPTNPHRFAGFKVLKAPDVPSVLLELGYLSNSEDEAQLRDPEWRAKAAKSILGAIEGFVAGKHGAGG